MSYTEAFEKFWKAYPRRVSKLPASKAFEKLEPDQQLAAQTDVEKRNRMHWWSGDPRKIPHAATYLNAHRFEDEWEEDLIARREAMPSSAPRDYKPVDTPKVGRWKALGNRIGMKWLRTVGGLGDSSMPLFVTELNSCVSDAEAYLDDDEDQADAALTFAELLLSRLDQKFGRSVGPRMLSNAKAKRRQ
jgi:hypothetical protein